MPSLDKCTPGEAQKHLDQDNEVRMIRYPQEDGNKSSEQSKVQVRERKWSSLYKRFHFLSSHLGLSLFSHRRVIILELGKCMETFGGRF